jgi:predicted porin
MLIGLSRLVWSKYPVSGTNFNDNESTTFLEGLRLGFEYSFSDYWSTFGEYQILKNEHKTNILGDNLKIAFQNNLNIGVYYKF